jgi:hypothetical protein
MGRPGNKRLQRAMYGASPSSDGSMATDPNAAGLISGGDGRADVQRIKGSVINNGGNMIGGLYPKIGMSLGFLRKIHATPPNCCKPLKD